MPLEDLIADFHQDLAALGPRGRGVRYPDDFISNTVALVALLREHGWTQQTIAQTLGITWPTLHRWSTPPDEHAPTFAPVELAHSPTTSAPAPSGVVLTSPTGWRIEGLDPATAVELVARWAC